jgi:hypothetical protein
VQTRSHLITGSAPDTPRMRPEIKAGLKSSTEATKGIYEMASSVPAAIKAPTS